MKNLTFLFLLVASSLTAQSFDSDRYTMHFSEGVVILDQKTDVVVSYDIGVQNAYRVKSVSKPEWQYLDVWAVTYNCYGVKFRVLFSYSEDKMLSVLKVTEKDRNEMSYELLKLLPWL